MDTPLEDIRFLADSENRFVALEALASGPHTRSDLRRATESSKATVSRLLGDFENRGWVTRDGQQYALTPLGEYVAGAFVEVYDRMATASDLQELLPWFPLKGLDVEFDLEVLTGARITAATPENPMAPVARVLEIEREAAQTKTLADRFPESCIKARHDAVIDRDQRCELVTTQAAIESVMTSSHVDKFADIVAADRATAYVHDGDLPPGGIHDGTAYLIMADDQEVNVGVIESDEPAIVDQLSSTFEKFREASVRLTPSMLEEGPDSIRVET